MGVIKKVIRKIVGKRIPENPKMKRKTTIKKIKIPGATKARLTRDKKLLQGYAQKLSKGKPLTEGQKRYYGTIDRDILDGSHSGKSSVTSKHVKKALKGVEKELDKYKKIVDKEEMEKISEANIRALTGETKHGGVKVFRKKSGETDEEFLKRTKGRKYGGKVIKRSTGGYINGNDLVSSIYK